MAKKINMDEIDESFIIAAVRKDRTGVKEINPPPLTPLPATAPPQEEEEESLETMPVSTIETDKKETRSKRASGQEYESLFIREIDMPPVRFGKTVYIRKKYHDRISQITTVIGENEVSMFAYIDNVLAHHLEKYEDDIDRALKKKLFSK